VWLDEITFPASPSANIPHLAYIANTGVSTVSVIDVRTNTVIANIPVCGSPRGVAVTPNGLKAYVACGSGVNVIDTVKNTVVATLPLGGTPWGIAITPNGTRAYVTHWSATQVSVIDTATDTLLAPIPAVAGAGIDINSAGTMAYVNRANGTETLESRSPATRTRSTWSPTRTTR
jgi:YVTN family beta-propeller protein